jgi:hypothetical protein
VSAVLGEVIGDMDSMCYACMCSTHADRSASLGPNYCKAFEDDKAKHALWYLVGTVIVVLLNQALKAAVIVSAPFAKAHTMSLQMMATTTRIFMCQFVNYIVLVFMVRAL